MYLCGQIVFILWEQTQYGDKIWCTWKLVILLGKEGYKLTSFQFYLLKTGI